VGQRLFEDLVLSASGSSRTSAVRSLPLSLGVHALAVAALTTWSLSAVRERPLPGPLVFHPEPRPAGGAPRAIVKTGGARPPRRGPRPPAAIVDARPPVAAGAPAAVIEPDISAGTADDSPICLTGCGPGDPGPGEGTGIGTAGPGGEGEGEGPGAAVRVGGDIREPRRIHGIAPVYPDLARRARVQGKVLLECVIDTDGRVTDLHVVSGNPLLAEAATEAVRRWVYSPTTLNGQPIRVILTVTVRFGLAES
jgi:protein TonB